MPHQDYIVNGDSWPSATDLTALLPKDWLWAWYRREVKKHGWRGWQKCKAASNRGKRIGTHLHGLVEMGLTGRPYTPYLDYAARIIEPKRRLEHLHKMAHKVLEGLRSCDIEKVEEHLVSETLRLHGTVDYILRDELPGLSVDDLKTTVSIDNSMPIQLAIYARLWNGTYPDQRIDRGRIRRADKKSPTQHVQLKEFNQLHFYYPVIDALRVIWDYENKKGPWEPPSEE